MLQTPLPSLTAQINYDALCNQRIQYRQTRTHYEDVLLSVFWVVATQPGKLLVPSPWLEDQQLLPHSHLCYHGKCQCINYSWSECLRITGSVQNTRGQWKCLCCCLSLRNTRDLHLLPSINNNKTQRPTVLIMCTNWFESVKYCSYFFFRILDVWINRVH